MTSELIPEQLGGSGYSFVVHSPLGSYSGATYIALPSGGRTGSHIRGKLEVPPTNGLLETTSAASSRTFGR
jgi:hypothetical protein